MDQISYKLDKFEGPLDLLLTLINKNKIDITDIPISLLCDQYLEYINFAKESNIEIASEFLLMASELMLIKSKMLLPRTELEEVDPRAALAEALLEYQRAKEASKELKTRFEEFGLRLVKDTDEILPDKQFVASHDIDVLTRAYNRLINEIHITDEAAKNNFEPIIQMKSVSFGEVISKFKNKFELKRSHNFVDLFKDSTSKIECIITFMAMLELLKAELLILEEVSPTEDGVITTRSDDVVIKMKDDVTPDDFSDYINKDE